MIENYGWTRHMSAFLVAVALSIVVVLVTVSSPAQAGEKGRGSGEQPRHYAPLDNTPTATVTPTHTPTLTPTNTQTSTDTPTTTLTPKSTETHTPTPSPSASLTPTATPTSTHTSTPTHTSSPTLTVTPTVPPTSGPSPTPAPQMLFLPLIVRVLPGAVHEPNNSFGQAWGPMPLNEVFQSYIYSEQDSEDFFFFDMSNSGAVDIWLRHIPERANNHLYLYDQSRALKGYSGNPGNEDEHVSAVELAAGKYYVRVQRVTGYSDTQPYSLWVAIQ